MSRIYKRGKTWYADYRDSSGKRVRRVAGTTKGAAEAILRREATPRHSRRLPDTGGTPRRAEVTLAELFDAYAGHLRARAKPASVEQVEIAARHLARILGDLPAADLTAGDVDAFVASRRRERVSATTINGTLRNLRAVLRFSVERGLLSALPFRVRLLRAPTRRELPILGRSEIDQLLAHAPEPYRGIILVAAYTGFRLGEVLHLTWTDVHWADGRLTVTGKNGWQPKSYAERGVYVPRFVMADLQKRPRNGSGYVFEAGGRPITKDKACRHLKAVWESAGLYRPGTPTTHWLRHSIASRLLGAGVDVETTRQILGHASAETTLLYAHSTDRRLREAARLME